MLKVKLFLIIFIFLLSGCNNQQQASPIKLITNAWIGYSPLFYAKEKGWLEETNVELSTLVSLNEGMMTFKMGGFDGITGTQYEYQKLNNQHFDLVPIIMFDRSNGGDMVMSNLSLETLKNTTESIDVYLETNSVNSVIFKDFIKTHQLANKSFHFINKNQLKIVTHIKQQTINKPTIVVTYVPYNYELLNKGFKVLESTRDNSNIMVLDALFVDKNVLNQRHNDFIALKMIINKAIKNLKENPKEYYEVVKPYLENPSFDDFNESLKGIEWLNDEVSDTMIQKMNAINFQTRNLI